MVSVLRSQEKIVSSQIKIERFRAFDYSFSADFADYAKKSANRGAISLRPMANAGKTRADYRYLARRVNGRMIRFATDRESWAKWMAWWCRRCPDDWACLDFCVKGAFAAAKGTVPDDSGKMRCTSAPELDRGADSNIPAVRDALSDAKEPSYI
jgi:hypothetical protein